MTLAAPTPDSAATSPLTLAIDGMTCGHCVAAVTRALAAVPDIVVGAVTVGSATVALTGTGATDPRRMAAVVENAIADAGFTARVVEPASPAAAAGHPAARA